MAAIDEIRKRGQWSEVGLIIDAPDTVYSARATGAVDTTDYSIGYNTGSGTLANALPDMTLLIGTSAGGAQRGVARLRKAPDGSKFYIGADRALDVQAGDYLTVLNAFALWAKHPKSTYIDVDVAYTNQHSVFDPVPFGPSHAVINAGGSVAFDGSASWVIGSTITGHAWASSPAASSSTGTTTATPTFTYNSAGRYRVAHTLTAANGQTWTIYYWVFVLGTGLSAEYGFSLTDPQSDSEAGASFRVGMFSRPTIRDRALVILFAKDYYDGTLESFGPVTGRENILCIGWIVGETIRRDPMRDWVEFEVQSTKGFLDALAASPTGLQDANLPTEEDDYTPPPWAVVSGLTTQKALYHMARWRSTITRCVPFSVEYYGWAVDSVAANESLGQQMAVIASKIRLKLRSDRLGRLVAERDAQNVALASRAAIPVAITLTDADWQGEMTIVRRQVGDVSGVTLEGHVFIPSQHQLVPIGATSPAKWPLRFGSDQSESELIFPDQATALELAGLAAGAANAQYEAVDVTLFNNRLIDVTPRQYVQLTIDGATVRTIPRRIAMRWDSLTGFMTTQVTLEPEGGQLGSAAIKYPNEDDPPEEPPEEPPTEPPLPPEWPPEEPPSPGSNVKAIASIAGAVDSTQDITVSSPTWVAE